MIRNLFFVLFLFSNISFAQNIDEKIPPKNKIQNNQDFINSKEINRTVPVKLKNEERLPSQNNLMPIHDFEYDVTQDSDESNSSYYEEDEMYDDVPQKKSSKNIPSVRELANPDSYSSTNNEEDDFVNEDEIQPVYTPLYPSK